MNSGVTRNSGALKPNMEAGPTPFLTDPSLPFSPHFLFSPFRSPSPFPPIPFLFFSIPFPLFLPVHYPPIALMANLELQLLQAHSAHDEDELSAL